MDRTRGIILGLIFAAVLLIAMPILMDLSHQADVRVWISKLRQEGYSAWAAPDGDVVFSGDIVPNEDSAYDIGSPTAKWRDLYLSGSSIHLGDRVITDAGDQLKTDYGAYISGTGAYTYLVGVNTADDDVPGDTGYWVKNRSGKVVRSTSDAYADDDIQWAIDNLSSAGGLVQLSEGTFRITDSINLSGNYKCIEGQGEGTVLRMAADGFNVFQITGNWAYSYLANMRIDGNERAYAGRHAIASNSGVVSGNIHIHHITFYKIKGSVIHGDNLWDWHLHNLTIESCGDETSGAHHPVFDFQDVDANTHCDSIYMNSIHMETNYWHGIYWAPYCLTLLINNVKIHNSATSGIRALFCEGKDVQATNVWTYHPATATDQWSIYSSGERNTFVNVNVSNPIYLSGLHDQLVGAVIYAPSDRNGVEIAGYHIEIANVEVRSGKSGIYVSGGGENVITACNVYHVQQHGFNIAGNRVQIVNCVAHECGQAADNTYDGFYISGQRVLMNNCFSRSKGTANQHRWGINYVAGATNGAIIGCMAEGNKTGAIQAVENSVLVRNNIGYPTEASGEATISSGSTSVTVTHGLAITPDLNKIRLVLKNNPTNDPGNLWVSDATSTTFVINCRNDPGTSGAVIGWSYQE